MLPAFGRELLDARLNGMRPTKPVYVTDDWDVARELKARARFVLMVPDYDKSYDFLMLRDLDVIALPSDFGFVAKINPQIRAVRPHHGRYLLVCESGKPARERADEALAFEAGEFARQAAAR